MSNRIERGGRSLPYPEFLAICAFVMSLTALSIDIVLPAILVIGDHYGVVRENDRQWLIAAYLIPFGLGQLLWGTLSDSFGRKPIILIGLTMFGLAAFCAPFAPNYEILIALRALAGFCGAAGRVAVVAAVRDCFEGRQMASVMSIIMMIFMAVPIIAPSLGQLLLFLGNWWWIFATMGLISTALLIWVLLRLPETLTVDNRRELSFRSVTTGFAIVLSTRRSMGYSLSIAFMMGALFGFVNSAAQIYYGLYDLGAWSPIIFSIGGAVLAVASLANSRLVKRHGMHRISHIALVIFCVIATGTLIWSMVSSNPPNVVLFVILTAIMTMLFGFLGPNFNALAMQPLGARAGMAGAVFGFMQATIAGLIGAAIGQTFNGTVVPILAGFLLAGLVCIVTIFWAERGQMPGLMSAEKLEAAANRPPRQN